MAFQATDRERTNSRSCDNLPWSPWWSRRAVVAFWGSSWRQEVAAEVEMFHWSLYYTREARHPPLQRIRTQGTKSENGIFTLILVTIWYCQFTLDIYKCFTLTCQNYFWNFSSNESLECWFDQHQAIACKEGKYDQYKSYKSPKRYFLFFLLFSLTYLLQSLLQSNFRFLSTTNVRGPWSQFFTIIFSVLFSIMRGEEARS